MMMTKMVMMLLTHGEDDDYETMRAMVIIYRYDSDNYHVLINGYDGMNDVDITMAIITMTYTNTNIPRYTRLHKHTSQRKRAFGTAVR